MDATQTTTEQRPDAVAWIDEHRAIVARRDPAGGISTVEVRRLGASEARFVGLVAHEIAGRDRVMIVGSQPLRLALERRYVAVSHHPEGLVAASPQRDGSGADVIGRLAPAAA
jgi:hypothetical protein